MRTTNRALLSVALLAVGPFAAAAVGDSPTDFDVHTCFDYFEEDSDTLGDPDPSDGVERISFLSEGCGDGCGCSDDLGCGEDCGCGEGVDCCGVCGDGCGASCGCLGGGKCKKNNGLFGLGSMEFGGELRLRYHSEESQGFPGQLGFQGTNEDFLLIRFLPHLDWQVNDWARVYVRGIFAENNQSDTFVPRPIDENRGDFLNAFIDLKLTDSLTFRVGRQDHLYSAQRLLSPLDWANTRQRFEGLKLLYKHDDWAIDAFWTVFVPADPDDADEGDYNRRVYGAYATYTGAESASFDFFYIGFDDDRQLAPILSDFSLHTVGSRVWGGQGSWLYDFEGGYQFGRQSGLAQDHRAAYFTAGLGKKLSDCGWKPTLWFYYDYATGNDEADGNFNRFNQLFPLAHKYLGFADFAQRANISSPNVLLTMAPSKKWNLLLWYYYLGAADQADIVPGVATLTAPNGAVAPAGLQNAASEDFAHELDIIAKYTINEQQNILFGYSNVWAGDKLENGPVALLDSDANFFYTQWTIGF